MLIVKDGLKGARLTEGQAMACIIQVVVEAFGKYRCDAILTEGIGGKHMRKSLHPSGRAFDWRMWHLEEERRKPLVVDIRTRLGEDFDVIYHQALPWARPVPQLQKPILEQGPDPDPHPRQARAQKGHTFPYTCLTQKGPYQTASQAKVGQK